MEQNAHPACCRHFGQELGGLYRDEASHNCIGGRDGMYNIPCHTLQPHRTASAPHRPLLPVIGSQMPDRTGRHVWVSYQLL